MIRGVKRCLRICLTYFPYLRTDPRFRSVNSHRLISLPPTIASCHPACSSLTHCCQDSVGTVCLCFIYPPPMPTFLILHYHISEVNYQKAYSMGHLVKTDLLILRVCQNTIVIVQCYWTDHQNSCLFTNKYHFSPPLWGLIGVLAKCHDYLPYIESRLQQ